MPPPNPHERIDITRLNRKERRNITHQIGAKIPGRNLPYEKMVPSEEGPSKMRYMPLNEFNAIRAKEIEIEKREVIKRAEEERAKNPVDKP